MTGQIAKQLILDIEDCYGSLVSPSWRRIERRYDKQIYKGMIDQIAQLGDVQEFTDDNDDVSVVISIDFRDGTDGSVGVKLSLVGDYACLTNVKGKFLSPSKLDSNPNAFAIAKLLQENGMNILDHETMAMKLNFNGEETPIYEILFSTDYGLEAQARL